METNFGPGVLFITIRFSVAISSPATRICAHNFINGFVGLKIAMQIFVQIMENKIYLCHFSSQITSTLYAYTGKIREGNSNPCQWIDITVEKLQALSGVLIASGLSCGRRLHITELWTTKGQVQEIIIFCSVLWKQIQIDFQVNSLR